MMETIKELTKERRLVLECSRGNLNDEHTRLITEILSGPVDWKEVLYQCVTHRTLNIMYYHLKRLNLTDKVENEVLKMMKNESKIYGLRNRVYFKEIDLICKRLKEKNIKAAVLKGNFLAAHVYPSVETRTFNDLDFLIDLNDGDEICKVLEELEYIQGEYNEETGTITPANRKQKMMHQLTNGELHECLKKTNEPFVPLLNVDLNYTILWKGNCPYRIETSELLARAREVDVMGSKTFILDNEDFLIQLACHLFKEATIISWIHDLRDLKLYKFADILMFIEKYTREINWEKLIETCRKAQLEKVLYYTFYYVNQLYGAVVPATVMAAIKPGDLAYLDEYGSNDEKSAKWSYDFFTRLFETSRILEVSEEMLGVVKRYWKTKTDYKGDKEATNANS